MNNLKEIKKATVLFGFHSPLFREIVKIQASSNKVSSHYLASVSLSGP